MHLAQSGTGNPSIAEKEDGSNGTIVPFVTFDDSRRDSETCWLLEVGSLTNPPGSVISSPKTKDSVIPQAEWSWSEDSANVSQGRTNVNIQPTPVEWAMRKGRALTYHARLNRSPSGAPHQSLSLPYMSNQ